MLTAILTTMWSQADVDRFAGIVNLRLRELGRGQDLSEYGGPSDTTLRAILRGNVDGRHRSTWNKLDDGLDWTRGSSERVLDGGEPQTRVSPQNDPPPHPPLSAGETADLEAGVQKLMLVQAALVQRGEWDLASTLGEVIQTATRVGRELSALASG